MKVCFVCKENKKYSEFYKSNKSKDGLHHYCKNCLTVNSIKRKRTPLGMLKTTYSHQKRSNIKRGHGIIPYSQSEFIKRYIDDTEFLDVFIEWEKSEYQKMKTPSFDRLDDFKGYSFDNLRVVKWEDNTNKGHFDRMMGIGTQGEANCKAVLQFDDKGNFIAEYYSIMEAERATGVSGKHIPSVCKGKRKKAGGFIWKHKYTKEDKAI